MRSKPMSPPSVGVRELKNHASALLRRVKKGEAITITDRRRPVAVMIAIGSKNLDSVLPQLCQAGRLAWGGGKPSGELAERHGLGGFDAIHIASALDCSRLLGVQPEFLTFNTRQAAAARDEGLHALG